ncbi:MAG TPA: hypothetical protein VG348_13145 [Acidimicrobiia bacterium]|jgi:hypothetical protein|nr:hypothetical protein [Acidimicrobiia bacterium]
MAIPATAACVAAALALGGCSSGGDSTEKSDVQKFLNMLDVAVRTGNTNFRVAHLNQAVIDRYGEQQCRDFLAGQQDKTRKDKVKKVGKPESFEYATDDQSVVVPQALPVQVHETSKGKKGDRNIHLARINGRFSYFIDCGGPLVRQ